jgi:hypothetical protein
MHLLAIPCVVLAAINCCVAGFYLVLYVRRHEPREHLPFALLCLAFAGYDLFSAELYDAQSLANGILWQRLQLLAMGPITVCVAWFVGLVTKRRLGWVIWGVAGLFAVLAPLVLLVDWPGVTLSLATPAAKAIHWRGAWLITYHESQVGLIASLATAVVYAVFAFLLSCLYDAYRRERSAYLATILVGMGAFFVGIFNDGLVANRVYVSVYVSEYAYFLLVIAMAHALLGRFLDLHSAVEELNRTLEQKVKDALADLRVLRGLIPICASCKSIRDDQGYWSQLEEYISRHSAATFSHGICPACMDKLYPGVAQRLKGPRSDRE